MNFFLYIWLILWSVLLLVQFEEWPPDKEEWKRTAVVSLCCLFMIALGVHRLYQ